MMYSQDKSINIKAEILKIKSKTYVVGMSIEKLFDMWRNFEFSRNLFFEVQNWDSQDSAETAAHIT